jgi:glycerol-3-phosphate dehydrogenase (NAD(P)+)
MILPVTTHILILGAGAWGMALAHSMVRKGHQVHLWSRDPVEGPLPAEITIVLQPDRHCHYALALMVVPSQGVRDTIRHIRDQVQHTLPIVIASKGLEVATGSWLTEVVAIEMPHAPVALLSGPNFAHEVRQGLPAAFTLACHDQKLGKHLASILGSRLFRPYLSADVMGVQVVGAAKNVLAIACGIVQGKGLGENALAALITRGIAEINSLSIALGGKSETMLEMAGIGDIVLTCRSSKSRNFSLGERLGQGQGLEQALEQSAGVSEGVTTCQVIAGIAQKQAVEMPILQAIYAITHGVLTIDQAIETLLTREMAHCC